MAEALPALVIGAGISGLVCAHTLRQSGVEAHILEASPQAGGAIQSVRQDGYLLELGPQSFSGTAQLRDLCRELGIESQLEPAPARAPRFVLIDGRLKRVPLSPPAFFASSFAGARTKWAILHDALGRTTPPAAEETVAAFVRRKLSVELLERLVGPFVSGIYAGDPEKLSLSAAFPQLYQAEASAGSVVRGILRAAKRNKNTAPRPALLSFREGTATLPRTLAEKLGSALHRGARVNAIRWSSSQASPFLVTALVNGSQQTFATQNLILAAPSSVAVTLLSDLADEFSALAEIEYAPVAVVSLGYRKSCIGHSLEGFGFLVPRSAGLQILGSVWNSSLFSARAPEGHALLTSFVGGATNPAAIRRPAGQLTALMHSELRPILALAQPPVFSNVTVYERAIPQYNLGHAAKVKALQAVTAKFPGLFFAGNYLRGPAIGACVEHAQHVALQVLRRLNP